MKKFNIIPFFVSMQGCKRRCIYCNQYSLKGHRQESLDLKDFVLRESEKYKNKGNLELAFYGGTFFSLPENRLKYFKDRIIELKKNDLIKSARVSTTPDSINVKVLKMFKGVIDRVELGIQSLDDFVLKILRRGYTKKDVLISTGLLKKFDYEIGFQLMIGLPFDSRASYINTINEVTSIKPDFARLYPLFVIKNTPLSVYYRLGFFQPIKMEELIWRGMYGLLKIEKAGIKVIKIGLNEFVNEEELDFIHKHNDLKGLIMSNMYRKLISNYVNKNQIKKDLKIVCNKTDIHYLIGLKKENINYFEEKEILLKIKTGEIRKNHISIDGTIMNVFDLVI